MVCSGKDAARCYTLGDCYSIFRKTKSPFLCKPRGFHVVEFYNSQHPDPGDPDTGKEMNEQFPEGMFRFEKKIAPDGNVSRKN